MMPGGYRELTFLSNYRDSRGNYNDLLCVSGFFIFYLWSYLVIVNLENHYNYHSTITLVARGELGYA